MVGLNPHGNPDWIKKEDYENFPETMRIRETKVAGKVLVTTLLSPGNTPKSELSKLYKQRWHVELYLRNIKTTQGMKTLRCMTPQMNVGLLSGLQFNSFVDVRSGCTG